MPSALLAMVARVKAARQLDNLDALSDADLIRHMASFFSDDADERDAVADLLALTMRHDRQATVALFDELGVSISPDEIAELRRDPGFPGLKALLLERPASEDDRRHAAKLIDAVRSYCGIGADTAGELDKCA